MMRIVVVDDDPEASQFVADALSRQHYDVVQINQADGILARLTEVRPDLAILDVMYPDNPTFGFELARSIRRTRQFRHLPIVLQTGLNRQYPLDFSDADIDPEWLPVQKIVEKSVDLSELLQVVAVLLGRKCPPA